MEGRRAIEHRVERASGQRATPMVRQALGAVGLSHLEARLGAWRRSVEAVLGFPNAAAAADSSAHDYDSNRHPIRRYSDRRAPHTLGLAVRAKLRWLLAGLGLYYQFAGRGRSLPGAARVLLFAPLLAESWLGTATLAVRGPLG